MKREENRLGSLRTKGPGTTRDLSSYDRKIFEDNAERTRLDKFLYSSSLENWILFEIKIRSGAYRGRTDRNGIEM